MLCSLSSLKAKDIAMVQSLEKELDQTLLAFSCHSVDPALVAADKLAKIQDLEKKLGISLVAIKK